MTRLLATLLLLGCAKPVCVQVHEHTLEVAERSGEIPAAELEKLRTEAARDEAVGFCDKRLTETERQCVLESERYEQIRTCLTDYKRRVCVKAVDHVLTVMTSEAGDPNLAEALRKQSDRAIEGCMEKSTWEQIDCMLAAQTMDGFKGCVQRDRTPDKVEE